MRNAFIIALVGVASLACDRSPLSEDEGRSATDLSVVERLTLGAVEGDSTQVFGDVPSIALTRDRIYILDRAIPTVRVFDRTGTHLFDAGRRGQGPGEFDFPYLLSADSAGRILVRDQAGIEVFSPEGDPQETWIEPGGVILPQVVLEDGTLVTPTRVSIDGEVQVGMVSFGPDGARGPFRARPDFQDANSWFLEAVAPSRSLSLRVPFAPPGVWGVLPSGIEIEGVGDAYRLTLTKPDSSTLVLERESAGIPIDPEVRSRARSTVTERMTEFDPSWSWNGNPVPDRLPYFERVYGDRSRRIWVLRRNAVTVDPDCTEGDCLIDGFHFDLFRESGEFLGEVHLPVSWDTFTAPAFAGDDVAVVTEGAFGVPVVRVFGVAMQPE